MQSGELKQAVIVFTFFFLRVVLSLSALLAT
jgi:hypothetical protein